MNDTEELRFIVVNTPDIDVQFVEHNETETALILYDPLTIFDLLQLGQDDYIFSQINSRSFVDVDFVNADYEFGSDLDILSLADSHSIASDIVMNCQSSSTTTITTTAAVAAATITTVPIDLESNYEFSLNDEITRIIDNTISNSSDSMVYSTPPNSSQLGRQIGDIAEDMNKIYVAEIWEG